MKATQSRTIQSAATSGILALVLLAWHVTGRSALEPAALSAQIVALITAAWQIALRVRHDGGGSTWGVIASVLGALAGLAGTLSPTASAAEVSVQVVQAVSAAMAGGYHAKQRGRVGRRDDDDEDPPATSGRPRRTAGDIARIASPTRSARRGMVWGALALAIPLLGCGGSVAITSGAPGSVTVWLGPPCRVEVRTAEGRIVRVDMARCDYLEHRGAP